MRELQLIQDTTCLKLTEDRITTFVGEDILDWEDFREVKCRTQYGHERIGFGENRRIGVYPRKDDIVVVISNGFAEVYLSFVPEDCEGHVTGPDTMWQTKTIRIHCPQPLVTTAHGSGDDYLDSMTLGFCN